MFMRVISNPDASQKIKYEIARVVYAENTGSTLCGAESLASMIANAARARGESPIDIVRDPDVFDVLRSASPRHARLKVAANDAVFQMCLRVVQKMLKGNLADSCCGATRFHHDDVIPDWATARGYIAHVDDILFYL